MIKFVILIVLNSVKGISFYCFHLFILVKYW